MTPTLGIVLVQRGAALDLRQRCERPERFGERDDWGHRRSLTWRFCERDGEAGGRQAANLSSLPETDGTDAATLSPKDLG